MIGRNIKYIKYFLLLFFQGDIIIKEGTIGSKMYFIQEGIVDIVMANGDVSIVNFSQVPCRILILIIWFHWSCLYLNFELPQAFKSLYFFYIYFKNHIS